MEANAHPRERGAGPGDVRQYRIGRGRFRRDRFRLAAARRPCSPVLFDEGRGRVDVEVEVAGEDDGRVLGAVPAFEKRARVAELVRHLFNVADETHGGVLVGVRGVGVVSLDFDQFAQRVGAVLVVFAQHSARFGLEIVFRVREVHEAVGFEFEYLFEILLRAGYVIVGIVIRRVSVLASARARDDLLISVGRVSLGAAEHHVLEEVRESALARFHFVARTRLHGNLERDQVWESGVHHDDSQTVGERPFEGWEREDRSK